MRGEIIPGEQSVEDRFGDHMLRQHRDRIRLSDPIVEIGPQRGHEVLKSASDGGVSGVSNQSGDAFGVTGGDISDRGRPVLPILSLTDFLHDPGINGIPPLLQTGELQIQHTLTIIIGDDHCAILADRGRQHLEASIAVLVEVDFIDHGFETVIMRPQRVQH